MNAEIAKQMLDKIVGQLFGYQNPFTLEVFMERYAFDVKLPQQVFDSTTNQQTWADSTNPTRFITMDNAWKRQDEGGWEIPPRQLSTIEDVLTAWGDINLTATERSIQSDNMAESDNILFSSDVFRSIFITNSKNILFSDGLFDCEFMAASQRSKTSNFGIRVDDSQNCSNSFNVNWSDSVSNSMFISDCKNVHDSMFCSHLHGKRFCVANMQFDEAEYRRLKDIVIRWILTS